MGGKAALFRAWGSFVYRHRRAVRLVSVVLAIANFPLAGQATKVLSSGGCLVRGSESAVVGDRLAQEFNGGRSSMARTAAVITGAALIMVCVSAAFALAETITITSIGVGMAIAVLLDATVIRIFLVPATMPLMGRWNWWAPRLLGRLTDRLVFSHVEDAPADESFPAPAPTSA